LASEHHALHGVTGPKACGKERREMKTTVIHLEGIESVLAAPGVEQKLCRHPGIHKVETNFVTGIAAAYHDKSVTLAAIKQCVADYGSQQLRILSEKEL
jgi:copper chaperone CopZ